MEMTVVQYNTIERLRTESVQHQVAVMTEWARQLWLDTRVDDNDELKKSLHQVYCAMADTNDIVERTA